MLLPLILNLWDISADLGGDTSIIEAQIVAGGQQTTITLNNSTWVASGATFDAERQGIINGFDSAQSELTGWNNEVRDKEVVTAVVRTSDTVVTITWTASGSYSITADETITVTIPASAVATGSAIIATPTMSINEGSEDGLDKKKKFFQVFT